MDNEGRINNEPPQMNNEPIMDNKPIMNNEPAAQPQPEFKIGESKELTRAERDAFAQSWVEKQLGAEKTAQQILAELMATGANLKSCLASDKEIWKPQFAEDDDKRMILLTGYIGSAVSTSILRDALKLAIKIPRSKSLEGTNLYMLPYPRFTEEGGIDAPSSDLLVLSGEQVKNIQDLLSSLDSQE